MHFQYPPAAETKLVRCTRGAILDIIVDLRPESPTYLEHVEVELSADNDRALYVPERFAHGYQVLEDTTETSYQVGEFYAPGTRAACRRRPGLGLELAAAGDGDLREGRAMGAALGGRGRGQASGWPSASATVEGAADDPRRHRTAPARGDGRPIRVALIGAGFMAQGLANQIAHSVPGMRVAAIYGRKLDRARGSASTRARGRCGRDDAGRGRGRHPRRAAPW